MSAACRHKFIGTSQKGFWEIEACSVNNRGNPKIETVPTTIFRCEKCGSLREYPDIWERNFVTPTVKYREWKTASK